MTDLRWEGDERGLGVADAAAFAGPLEDLLHATRGQEWVAEDPDVHLLPHLRRACETLPLRLANASLAADGAFDVGFVWLGETGAIGEARAAVFALIGAVAEMSTYVRQHPDRASGLLRFDVVTGFVGDEGRFAAHGHTLRVSIDGV